MRDFTRLESAEKAGKKLKSYEIFSHHLEIVGSPSCNPGDLQIPPKSWQSCLLISLDEFLHSDFDLSWILLPVFLCLLQEKKLQTPESILSQKPVDCI